MTFYQEVQTILIIENMVSRGRGFFLILYIGKLQNISVSKITGLICKQFGGPLVTFMLWSLKGMSKFRVESFVDHLCFLCLVFLMCSRLFIAALWSADLLALVGDVYCIFVTLLCGILGQVWYLIVSFPDLCRLSYFENQAKQILSAANDRVCFKPALG